MKTFLSIAAVLAALWAAPALGQCYPYWAPPVVYAPPVYSVDHWTPPYSYDPYLYPGGVYATPRPTCLGRWLFGTYRYDYVPPRVVYYPRY